MGPKSYLFFNGGLLFLIKLFWICIAFCSLSYDIILLVAKAKGVARISRGGGGGGQGGDKGFV